jgi:predicted component of type VI protein secretion system
VELLNLKHQAALAGDQPLNQRLKEVTRILRSPNGPFSDSGYERLQERVANELFTGIASEERAIQEKKEHLVQTVRRGVERELVDERAELQAREDQAAEREANVAARERKASPSYRAAFAAAGALLAVFGDLLIRFVV